MKKRKKTKDEQLSSSLSDSVIKNRLIRQREQQQAKLRQAEKSRTAVFKRRVRNASDTKAPKALRTKAYYRFAEKYPSTVSPDGYRENTPESTNLSKKGKITLLAVCCVVFALAFTLTQTGIFLSEKPSGNKTDPPVINKDTALSGYHVTTEEILNKTAEELAASIKAQNCNLAIFEFKSEYGYVYFQADDFMGSSADKIIQKAAEQVTALSSLDIKCGAYISCFKDTVAASALTGAEIRSSDGLLFTDADGNAWLNPFSSASCEYIINIIASATKYNFDYYFLDNVCFPYSFSALRPEYGEYDTTAENKNKVLVDFINTASQKAADGSVVIMGDITAFYDVSTVPDEKYGLPLLSSNASAYCLDLRSKRQNKAQLTSSDIFNYVEEMHLAFILEAGSLADDTLTQAKQAALLFAVIDGDTAENADYTRYSGIENIIYW